MYNIIDNMHASMVYTSLNSKVYGVRDVARTISFFIEPVRLCGADIIYGKCFCFCLQSHACRDEPDRLSCLQVTILKYMTRHAICLDVESEF